MAVMFCKVGMLLVARRRREEVARLGGVRGSIVAAGLPPLRQRIPPHKRSS